MIKRMVVLVLTISLVFPFPLFSAMIGEFAVVTGDVTVKRAGKIIKPKVKDKVETLDFIQTGKNSNARVVLSDETSMALGPNSRLEMKQFTVQGGKTMGLFSVPVGLVQTNVAKALGPGSKFEIQTPTAVAGVRGTAWITLVQLAVQAAGGSAAVPTTSTFYALSQTIAVASVAVPQTVTVAAGSFTMVAAGAVPTAVGAFVPATVAGLTAQLGAAAIPGVAGAAGAGAAGTAATGTGAGATGAGAGAGTAGAAGAGTAAATATVAGIGVGTIAIGVVAAAVIVGAMVATSNKNNDTTTTTTTHSSTSSHH